MNKDYYQTLDLPRNASQDDIKKAYRKMALKYHPDRNKDADTSDKFKEISEAYEILSDEQKKRSYDQFGHTGNGRNAFNDIFSDFFGSHQRPQGADLRAEILVTLEEAYNGSTKSFFVYKKIICKDCQGRRGYGDTCPQCSGHGKVHRKIGPFISHSSVCNVCGGSGIKISSWCKKCSGKGKTNQKKRITINIPRGIPKGYFRIMGEGEQSEFNSPYGDLYCSVRVQKHSRFKTKSDNLYLEEKINIAQACLGDTITIKTIDGNMQELKIPEGTQPGTSFKIKNAGMPNSNSSRMGDLYVNMKVEVPTNLSEEQKSQLLKMF